MGREGNEGKVKKRKREGKEGKEVGVGQVVEEEKKRGNIKRRRREKRLVAVGVGVLGSTADTRVEVGAEIVTGGKETLPGHPAWKGLHVDTTAETTLGPGQGAETGLGEETTHEAGLGKDHVANIGAGLEAERAIRSGVGVAVGAGLESGTAAIGMGAKIVLAGVGAEAEAGTTVGSETDTSQGHEVDQEPPKGPRNVTGLGP